MTHSLLRAHSQHLPLGHQLYQLTHTQPKMILLEPLFITRLSHSDKQHKIILGSLNLQETRLSESEYRCVWVCHDKQCACELVWDIRYTVKKRFASFPSPAGMSLPNSTKLSLGGNNDVITELLLPRGSLVSDIPAGDGKLVNLFFTV